MMSYEPLFRTMKEKGITQMALAKELGVCVAGATVVDPKTSPKLEKHTVSL